MSTIYVHPVTGVQKKVSSFAFLWTLCFGCLYFALHGAWKHVFISIVVALITAGLSWFVYPFFGKQIVTNATLEQGYKPLNFYQPATQEEVK